MNCHPERSEGSAVRLIILAILSCPHRYDELRLESTAANSLTRDFREAEANSLTLSIQHFIQPFVHQARREGSAFSKTILDFFAPGLAPTSHPPRR
jgi:hypothetical protein